MQARQQLASVQASLAQATSHFRDVKATMGAEVEALHDARLALVTDVMEARHTLQGAVGGLRAAHAVHGATAALSSVAAAITAATEA